MIERAPITGDPVIIAPDRASRPNAYRELDEACPFCPGNETLTPPEIARAGDPWNLRVVPNKYPATDRHEVIIESRDHNATFDAVANAYEVVDTYVDRYYALSADAAHVSIFKNHGAMAGASIPHLHSQVIATAFVPPRVRHEAAAFQHRCQLCHSDDHLIRDTDNYRWIAPRGSMFAYEQWIVPKRHDSEIADPMELADVLQASARAMSRLGDSFNWIFMNFPRTPQAHWYVQAFPRLAVHAGFELGSGTAINAADPAEAARFYRR